MWECRVQKVNVTLSIELGQNDPIDKQIPAHQATTNPKNLPTLPQLYPSKKVSYQKE